MKTIGVRFRRASKIYTFEAAGVECSVGDPVLVETERGVALGRIAVAPAELKGPPAQPLKKAMRVANEEDLERESKNRELEKEAFDACGELVREKGLSMKLLIVESLFDRSKVIFYFEAEGRVDFRELVRDLARRFHTRIEMRQVGVRDEAKIIGGVGCCGRELCCAKWLSDFAPISVRMAKSQNIALNPAKISGICGRLMCCLAYEHKMYEELSRGMPKVGKKIETPYGEVKVIRRNALESSFTIYAEGKEIEVDLVEFREGRIKIPELEVLPKSKEAEEREAKREKRRAERRPQPRRPRSSDKKPSDAKPDNRQAGNKPEQKDNAPSPAGEKGKETKSDDTANQQQRRRRRRRRRPSGSREKKQDG